MVRLDFFVHDSEARELAFYLDPARQFSPSHAALKIVRAALDRERRRRSRIAAKRAIQQAPHAGIL